MYKLPKGTAIMRSSSRIDNINFQWSPFVTTRDAYYNDVEILRDDPARPHRVGQSYVRIRIPETDGYDEIRVKKKYLETIDHV